MADPFAGFDLSGLPGGGGMPGGGKKQRGSPGQLSPAGEGCRSPNDPLCDQSMQAEIRHIQQHYFKFYSCLEIESASDDLCVFHLASKREPARRLRISLSAQTAYTVLDDTKRGELNGRVLESFEQVMSAMDKGDFGDLLCGLAAAKLMELNDTDNIDTEKGAMIANQRMMNQQDIDCDINNFPPNEMMNSGQFDIPDGQMNFPNGQFG